MSDSPNRSFEQITRKDLRRLAQIALSDFEDLFARRAHSAVYANRLILLCLCQGAARHYLHLDRGVHDFDVWGFFQEVPDHPFPYRRIGRRDFGPSIFGRNPDDGDAFQGRRVDVIGRALAMAAGETPIEAVQRYLCEGRSESARRLSERPVVALWPEGHRGLVIWPGRSK